jgi:hypothetical protein
MIQRHFLMERIRENGVKNLKGAKPFQYLADTKWKRTDLLYFMDF